MPTLDLDAARAARQAADPKAKPPTIRFGGKTFTLPRTYPLAAAFAFDDNDSRAYLEALLGEAEAREFVKLGADINDVFEIMKGVSTLYAVDPGEASASSPSSARNGRRSRPISNGSTASTSAKRAGG
jgi:hypothetical protein